MSVVPIKSKSKGNKSTKPQDPQLPDLNKLRTLSAARMSDKHICLMLDISMDDFSYFRENSKEFRDAMEKGRAEAVFSCAQVILKAAQGVLGRKITTTDPNGNKVETYAEFGETEREQIKMAQLYLARHAPGWLDDRS